MQPAWPSWNFFLGDWKDDKENYIKVFGNAKFIRAVLHNRQSGWPTYQRITADDWGRWRCGEGVLQSHACRRCGFVKSFWRTHYKRLLMKQMKLGDVKENTPDPRKHERGLRSEILKRFGGGISMTFFSLDAGRNTSI